MKVYIADHNGVLADVAKNFELTDDINEAKAVVLWQDVIGWCKSVAQLAKAKKKPVIVMQHGLNAVIDYGSPRNYPLLADKLLVWSPSDIRLLNGFGIPTQKFQLTGTTIFSHLKPKQPRKERKHAINILFRPAHWDVEIEENYLVYDKLREIVRKIGANLIVKTHERCQSDKYENQIFSNRDEKYHLDVCADVLSKTDLEVAIAGDGTFELMAYAMDIPVITPLVWRERPFLDGATREMKYLEANQTCHFDDLEKEIIETLERPNKKQLERKQTALDYGGYGLNLNPLEEITNAIKQTKSI